MSLFSSDLRHSMPFVLVIFGVTGDLARRKLIPALFELYSEGYLPERFIILGFARRDWTVSDMVVEAGSILAVKPNVDQTKLKQFFTHFDYLQGNFDAPTDYQRLAAKMEKLDELIGQCGRRLFYLATPAETYLNILAGIKYAKLEKPCGDKTGWTRIVIEKPFGHDLVSSQSLDLELTTIFEEAQIYRIDHYLAKETVQNIMTFRFANTIFEPIWNADYIERIEIVMHEDFGIGTRGNFYDNTGALRDIVQNHLLQLLALITMEKPKVANEKAFRDERSRLLSAIQVFDLEHLERNILLGQYASYIEEPDVKPNSNVETFAAIHAEIDLPRWNGVQVFLVTGKRMKSTMTKIRVAFKNTPNNLFEVPLAKTNHNVLTFDIQPTEGIGMQLLAKQPGYGREVQPVTMHFNYSENFKTPGVDAYSRLLLDAIDGDQTLFTRSDEVAAEWHFIDSIREKVQQHNLRPQIYEDGSDGPIGLKMLMGYR